MNSPKPVIKITAVALFALLISAFVAYRSDAFGLGAVPEKKTDTVPAQPAVDTPLTPENIMSSSKSAVIMSETDLLLKAAKEDMEKKEREITDSTKTAAKKKAKTSSSTNNLTGVNKEPLIMGSSKSGIIFKPKTDTAKKK